MSKQQSKKMTHIEIGINQGFGILIGWLIVYLTFPLFDHLDQVWVATISSCLFFVSSYTRSYIIRRIFNKLK